MCGIAGIVSDDPRERSAHVGTMLATLEHRGPDEEGIAERTGATIGARRLAIVDVLAGHQPMADESGEIVAVQNGEIYNFRALRTELEARGHHFTTDNDTEVLPHAYEEFGDDFVSRLHGMFALALWDGRRRRLTLARDRMGKKPLVYAWTREGFVFASEIQALLSLGIDRAVDEQAIRDYLTYGYIGAPRTAFRLIRKVRPGQVLSLSEGSLEERPYWRLSFEPKRRLDEPDAIAALDAAFAKAVTTRLISDVPLGAFLSGGLDSSTVVAYMARASAAPVSTFAIGFTDADFSELRYARIVAERFGTDHHEFVVEPSAADVLPMLVRHLGEPFADSSVIPTYYVAKMARRHVTVALNGDGGDELFAGYDRYRGAMLAKRLELVPEPLRRLVATLSQRIPDPNLPRAIQRARRFLATLDQSSEARYLRWIGYFVTDDIVGPRLRATGLDQDWMEPATTEARPSDELERLLAVDMRTYLPGDLLVKMDIASMAASVETRSPFLDHQLIELVTGLPSALKLRGRSKYLLRRLMRGTLPNEVLDRGKMGFGVPVGRWIRGPLQALVRECLLEGPERGYVDQGIVRRVVNDHLAGRSDQTVRVWALLMLELWAKHVLDAPAPADVDRIPAHANAAAR